MFIQKSLVLVILSLSALVLVNAQRKKGAPKDQRIVGGFETTIESEPYIVQLLLDNSFNCGGSILTGQWVLTAAHCVFGNEHNPSRFKVRAGSTTLGGSGGAIRQVTQVIRREDYDKTNLNNDVAMLKLLTALPLNGRTIATIALGTTEIPNGATVKVSGWGLTSEDGNVSQNLRSVYLSKMAQETCKKQYAYYKLQITDKMMCTTGQGEDACSGDSGGPLVYNNKVSGIVSWGVGCARSNAPGVYAPVWKFASYINSVMQNY